MKRRLKDLKISQKFLLSLTVFLLLPMLILLLGVGIGLQRRLDTKACDINLEVLKQTKAGVEDFTAEVEYKSVRTAADPDIQELIHLQLEEGDPQEIELIKGSLNSRLTEGAGLKNKLTGFSLFQPEQVFLRYGYYAAKEDESLLPSLHRLGGMPLWCLADVEENGANSGTRNMLHLYRAVNDIYTLETIAYERITIDGYYLRSLFEGMADEEGEICIVNEEGQILSATDERKVGLGYPSWEESGIRNGRAGYFQRGKHIVTYYWLDQVPWCMVKTDSAAALFQSSRAVYLVMAGSVLLVLLFGVIFVLIQRKSIIQPIELLSKETKEFRDDCFCIHIYDNGENEIGVLNRNLSGMVDYIQDLIQNQYKSEIRQKEIQLKYMQSQINPHFLYNTLDSIRWMAVVAGQDEIAQQIEALSDIFRHALNKGKEIVTVKQEVEHLQNYVLIQKNRFGDKIQISIHVEPEAEKCKVLKLILQPLVENAYVHGLEKKVGGGWVQVRIFCEGADLVYLVEDNGLGTDGERISLILDGEGEERGAFALRNIQERIRMKYGAVYGISFYSRPGEGARVFVRIPRSSEGGGDDGKTV